MGATFGQEIAVEAAGTGRYRGELSDEWCAPAVPQGGLVAAVAAGAMDAELGDASQRLRSVSVVFVAPVAAGEIEVDVSVLRRGRTMSQLTATVRNADAAAGTTAIAVFGTDRPGFEFTDLTMPVVPPPEECPSFRDPVPEGVVDTRPHFSYWERVEGRPALGHPPWEDYEPTTSERANWYRFEDPPTDRGVLDSSALISLCDTMPGAVGERLGGGERAWMPPSADLTVHVFREATSEWILGHNFARHAGDGYASLEMALWDPAVGLLAYGTQTMFFVFPPAPSPST